MEFSTTIIQVVIMLVVTGVAGFVGYHAGKRQGAPLELDSSRDALDLRPLSNQSKQMVCQYHQTRLFADKAKQAVLDRKVERWQRRNI